MGEATAIAWTDHTFNPWWGCSRVSPGCQHCYAEAFSKRTGNAVWGIGAERRRFGDKHWDEPRRWDRAAQKAGHPALVFCASMADVFEDRLDHAEDRARLWALISETPHLIWQLLTKRPQNVLGMVPRDWAWHLSIGDDAPPTHGWPSNVWIGTTVEDQQRADERIPHLLEIPAPVRFLSCEPLLGRVDLPSPALRPAATLCRPTSKQQSETAAVALNAVLRQLGQKIGWRGVDWIICGGESGANHRPLDLAHARNLRDQAHQYGIPFFFKQVGGRTPTAGGDMLDGAVIKQLPEQAAQ